MKKNGMTLSGQDASRNVDQTSCPRETVNQKYDIKHTNQLSNLPDNGYYKIITMYNCMETKKAACM